MKNENIVLTGMPAVGKSTVGVLLAKRLGWSFIDTDLLIQTGESRKLQEILDSEGMEKFCAIEEQHILQLNCHRTVVSTGGSVIYGKKAMARLKSLGLVVHLDLRPDFLKERLVNLSSRGIVMGKDQQIETLYQERRPLYIKYADAEIDCRNLSPDQVADRLEDLYLKKSSAYDKPPDGSQVRRNMQ